MNFVGLGSKSYHFNYLARKENRGKVKRQLRERVAGGEMGP